MNARLNPFSGLPNAREVWAWGMYDLANQSFQLLINTLLFGAYFATVIVGDPKRGEAAWGLVVSASMLVTLVVSPMIGALADARAWKREILLTSGVACAILTCALAFLGPGMSWQAVLLFLPASVFCGLGENFLGSFLPQIATPQTMGRVSAIGFAMSYLSALALLGLTALAVYTFGWSRPEQWRWLFVMSAAWFLLGVLPSFFLLRERANPARPARGARTLFEPFIRLATTIRQARQHRMLLRFLCVFFVFEMGTMTVVYFAGIIARNAGADIQRLLILSLVMTLGAGVAAVATGRFQDRIGHRRTVMTSLAVWTVSTAAFALVRWLHLDPRLFWAVAAGWGLGLGSLGTASRALVGVLTPEAKSGEFFGLWGMAYRLAAVAGVPLFGWVSTHTGPADRPEVGQAIGLLLVTGFFGVGFLLMLTIDDRPAADSASRGQATLTP